MTVPNPNDRASPKVKEGDPPAGESEVFSGAPEVAASSDKVGSNEDPILIGTRFNPVPEGVNAGFVATPDGTKLRIARWTATTRPSKGTVILLQGRSEFIEKYFETVDDLRSRGFGVLTFDWRGQGGSQRLLADPRRGHIEHFNQYITDLETVMTEIALPDCKGPFFVLAHSMGALVALLAAPSFGNRIDRMVLSAPLLALNGLPVSQNLLQRFAGAMSFIGFAQSHARRDTSNALNRPFMGNKLTSDIERFQRNRGIVEARQGLVLGAPTFGWTFAACRAMQEVHEPGFSNVISVPTLFLVAGNDEIVDPRAVEAYGHAMRAGAFLTISGAKHEILQERDFLREQALAAFDGFVPGSTLESLQGR